MLCVSLDLKSEYLLVDETGLDESKVDETAVRRNSSRRTRPKSFLGPYFHYCLELALKREFSLGL